MKRASILSNKKLNKYKLFLLIFIIFLGCNKKNTSQESIISDSFLKSLYNNYDINSLPWGQNPSKLQTDWQEYFIERKQDSIEFAIKAEVKDQKEIPILKELNSPYIFRFICYFNDNQCIIFKIEKFGSEKTINEYYKNFITTNMLNKNHLKKDSQKNYQSKAGNKIIEKYELYETDSYIIEVYLTNMIYPDDIKSKLEENVSLEENSDIDIRIYSKKYNPGINLDFFIKH